jgi:hypothetical protein
MANKKTFKSKKVTKRVSPPADDVDQFGILLEESNKFCKAMGLHNNLIVDIMKTDSDWAFTLKIDALLETAVKQVVRHGLRFKLQNRTIQNETLGDFVDSLHIGGGQTSLLKLLDAAGFAAVDCGFIEATRNLRNAYAHNIRLVDTMLIELIKSRGDRSKLIKQLSPIESFEEKNLIAMYEKDGGFLRFNMALTAMRIIFVVYHLSLIPPGTKPSAPYYPHVSRG